MRKLLIAIGLLILVLVGAALVAPSFIDWNRYRGEIAARVGAATGRELTIAGNVGFSVLPAPALSVADLRLANLPGAATPDMLRLQRLELRVALLPLLRGDIRVTHVTLVEPVVALERLADGRANWELAPRAKPPDGRAPAAGDGGGIGLPDVRIDSIAIERGTLTYRDAASGMAERVEAINLRASLDSLQGPLAARGDFRTRDLPVAFDLALGAFAAERAAPLKLALDLAGGAAKARFAGAVGPFGPAARLTGEANAEVADLAVLAARLGAGDVPALLAQPLAVQGKLDAGAEKAALDDMRLSFADASATGAINAAFGARPRIDAALQVNRLDLDRLLAAVPAPAERGGGGAGAPAPAGVPATPAPAKFALPTGFDATLDLGVAALVLRDGIIQQFRANAALAGGVLNLQRLGALFPGGSDVNISGRLAPANGEPRFGGRIEAASDNLRALLAWAGVDMAGRLPPERLRNLQLGAALTADTQTIGVSGLDLRLDASRVTGAGAYALRARPSFSLDLSVDRLNLDAYIPAAPPAEAKAAPAAGAPAAAAAAAADPWRGLRAFDANARLRVAQLTWHQTAAEAVEIDAALLNGKVTVKRAAVGSMAGATASLAGTVDASAAAPAFALDLKASGSDLTRTVRALGYDFRPAATNLGGFRLAAAIGGTAARLAVENLKATLGPANVEGRLGLALDAPRPKLTANLAASEVLLDLFLPAAAAAARPAAAPGRAAAAPVPTPAPGGRWSREPIDLTMLLLFDADVSLAARGLELRGYNFREPKLVLALADGTLDISQLQGRLFGGSVDLKGNLVAAAPPRAALDLTLSGADLRQALVTALGIDRVSGRFGMRGKFETRGSSEHDLVNALAGNAAVEASDGVVQGIDLRRLSDQLKRLDQVVDFVALLAGTMSGGQTRFTRASGTWRVERGVARSDDTRVDLEAAEGTLVGTIDLPNWQMDLVSRMRLTEHPNAPPVGVDLKGPIDQPVRDVKTRELERWMAERVGTGVMRRLLRDRGAEPAPTQPQAPTQPAPVSPAERLLRGILEGAPRR